MYSYSLPNQQDTRKRLSDFYRTGRFPHALLLYGEQGMGKFLFAQYAAMLLLCVSVQKSQANEKMITTPCMSCENCDKIFRKQHPDVIYPLELSAGKYKTETLKTVISEASTKPVQGDLRVYLFEELDNMSELCQNTLLRFIEEPTDANRFVFTANDMSGILPTILSRVTAVPVMESEYKSGADILRDWGLNTDAIQTLQTLYQDKNHLYSSDARSIASNIASALASKNEYAVVTAFSAITTREKLNETLDCLLTLFRDALLISSGRRDDTVSPAAVSLSQAVSVKRLFLAASKIQQYIADSVYNPNVGLCTAAYSGELFSILTQ